MNYLSLTYNILHYIPHMGLLSSLLLTLLLVYLDKWDILPYALTLLIPVIIVSLIYIWRKIALSDKIENFDKSVMFNLKIKQGTMVKIYGILFSLAVIWFAHVQTRDGILLILIVLLFTIPVVQIFAKKCNAKHIVIQLILTALLFSVTKIFSGYYYYAGGDSLVHTLYASSLVNNGFINASLFGDYTKFALMHIIVAIESITSSLPPNISLWIAVSLPLVITSIFIYYIAQSLTSSKRIGLLSLFFYLVTPIVLNYFPSAAPRTLATTAFVILLYLLISRNNDKERFKTWILGIIFLIYMILVHHAQLVLIYAVFAILFISLIFLRKKTSLSQKGLMTLICLIPVIFLPYLASWLKRLVGILDSNVIGTIDSTLNEPENPTPGIVDPTPGVVDPTLGIVDPTPGIVDPTPGVVDSTLGIVDPTPGIVDPTPGIVDPTPGIVDPTPGIVDPTPGVISVIDKLMTTTEVQSQTFDIFNVLNFSSSILMLIAILFGLFFLVHPFNQKSRVSIIWPISLLLFAVFIPGVADAFTIIAQMEQIGRLQIVLAPIFAIVMAIGAMVLGYIFCTKSHSPKVGTTIVIAFCLLLVLASPILSNSRDSDVFEALDNPKLGQGVNYFTEQEIYAFKHIETTVQPGSGILSDYAATRYFTTSKVATDVVGKPHYTFPSGTLDTFTDSDYHISDGRYFIFREDTYFDRGFAVTLYGGNSVGKDATSLKYDNLEFQNFVKNTYSLSTIYDVEDVEALKS